MSSIESVSSTHIWESDAWNALKSHADAVKGLHLRDLLKDEARSDAMKAEADGILLDYARQNATPDTLPLLLNLASSARLGEKIAMMRGGEHINVTEDRAVLHVALRAPKDKEMVVGGHNVVPGVHEVLDRISAFSERVRAGEWVGATGKRLTNVVSIGIGGSYLGPEFVFEALRHDPTAKEAAKGRTLRFLANVDPVDVARAVEGFDPEETLVVIVSKTFTTAETMLNARTLRNWLVSGISGADAKSVVARHMVAVSANVELASKFGIDESAIFGFWDWVGGRYSVCSAVGVVPLSLQYGFTVVGDFLRGAHAMDEHFFNAPLDKNLPVLMGLFGIWNSTFLGRSSRAILPYSQALLRFAAHIQQVDMESNGKRVAMDGSVIPFEAGEINFGEPGTNGQHSFYQLIHQGRVIPCDFIGFCEPQHAVELEGEPVSNHDELMSNFFAQPDALALGKTVEDLKSEGVPEALWPHKEFPGNRPSMSLLFSRLNAFTCGQLLALYEHRTAVQGFVWGICSFDQWGVELGKKLAKDVRSQLSRSRKEGASLSGFNSSTTALLKRYLARM